LKKNLNGYVNILKMKKIDMQKLTKEIQECKKCFLWKTRNKPLIGDGNIDADIMFIGEAPSYLRI